MIRLLFFSFLMILTNRAISKSIIEIGNTKAVLEEQKWVEIPINFKNIDKAFLLSFDVVIPSRHIDEVDIKQCLTKEFTTAFSGCNRLPAPNEDIVRYIIFSADFSPLPSGMVTQLKVALNSTIPSGNYPITIVDKTFEIANRDASDLEVSIKHGNLTVDNDKFPSILQRPPSTPILFSKNSFRASNNNSRFKSINENKSGIIESTKMITEDWTVVANNPETLDVNLPNGKQVSFKRESFKPKKGFLKKISNDSMVLDPKIAPEKRSFFWYGKGENAEIALTIDNGIGGGFITTQSDSYSIHGKFSNILVEKIKRKKRTNSFCLSSSHNNKFANYLRPLKTRKKSLEFDNLQNISKYSSQEHDIRVLVMYTQQAINDAQALSYNTSGQRKVDWIINKSMDQLNQATDNSGVTNVNFTLAKAELLPAFYTSTSGPNDTVGYLKALSDLRDNQYIKQLRNEYKADLVVTLIRNAETPIPALRACGVAFAQIDDCANSHSNITEYCSAGQGYNSFAHSMVSVDCALLDDRHSFVHEVGHMFGLMHQRSVAEHADHRLLYKNAYAYSAGSGANKFNTVMFSSVGEPHYLNFSNPNILINNMPSGNSRHNSAGAIMLSAPVVEQYRGIYDPYIFKDSYE